ncbi:hypothetical protein BVX99_02100 [bacterium F16]|nr:hypothetical protein BVX99_02100 [bacterium F16]
MLDLTYYGEAIPQAITYLECGEVNLQKGTKNKWEFQLHQKAYDWLMLSRYSNDILAYRAMGKCMEKGAIEKVFNKYKDDIHHGDDAYTHMSKLVGLAATSTENSTSSFYELGQTLFGCIDGMKFCKYLLDYANISLNVPELDQVSWNGVDISEFFNQMADLFHPDYSISAVTSPTLLPENMDVFFAKGITLLYAVRDVNDLFETLDRGRFAIFDYSFSCSEQEDTTIGSGKTVRYLPIKTFLKHYQQKDKVMYVNRNKSRLIPETSRIWLDSVYGSEAVCNTYIELDCSIRSQLAESVGNIPHAEHFLTTTPKPSWVGLEEYICELGLASL